MEPAPHLSGVYFDDYKVTYTPTNIVQYNEYYPYGLQTATSWTRENTTRNNFLGNGGTELNTTTSLYDLDYRNYDPALARMHQVDPMADKYASYTPYNYSFNAPSNFNDVNGADPLYENLYYYNQAANSGSTANVRIIDTGTFGGGHITPGSSGNWADGFRSMYSNIGLMSQSTFLNYYGINDDQSRFSAGQAMGMAVNIHAVQDGQRDWETYIGLGAPNTAWFINGKLIDVTRKGAAFFSADFSQYGSGVYSLEYKFKYNSSPDGSGGGGDFIYKNNNAIGLGIGIVEPGFGAAFDLVWKARATPGAFTTGAKVLGYGGGSTVVGLNVALTTYTIVHEYQNKQIDTHSYVNGIVTGVATVLTVSGLVITAPVWGTALAVSGAVIGIGYGVWQVSGGDAKIDTWSNHWGKNW